MQRLDGPATRHGLPRDVLAIVSRPLAHRFSNFNTSSLSPGILALPFLPLFWKCTFPTMNCCPEVVVKVACCRDTHVTWYALGPATRQGQGATQGMGQAPNFKNTLRRGKGENEV